MHNNAVTSNSSTGDELFSATPAGAGGVSICTGSDYYKFNYNWVCGNLSTGDGGGIGHIGFTYNGDIEYNSIIFNQSTNPTIPTNGGGVLVMGAPDADPTCGANTDQDCLPAPSTITPSDGTGPGLVINANLIQGNTAESGSGGGVMFQQVNGGDVIAFPMTPTNWNSVSFTNNIVANNVAGWDGAGISMLDSLKVNIVNNTIMSNDTTASAGVLFDTIGAPLASTHGTNCIQSGGTTASCPQPAGLVVLQNSAVFTANLPATINCPTGHFSGPGSPVNANCRSWSVPLLYNDLFWQNRYFNIQIGALGTGTQNQQHVVTLVPTLNQPALDGTTPNGGGVIVTGGTGACVSGATYWDLGARGDMSPTDHSSGLTLAPTYTILTSTAGYPGTGNLASNPGVLSQYCNGSRIPPEFMSAGYAVPPGIADATVPNPIFNLTPAATVDEGNNWINMAWGPLSLTNPTVLAADGNYGGGAALGNYALGTGSPAVNAGTGAASGVAAPTTDFFGNARPVGPFDIGAVELGGTVATLTGTVSPTSLTFTNVPTGTNSATQTVTLTNTGTGTLTGLTFTSSSPARFGVNPGPPVAGQCGGTLAAGQFCTIRVRFSPNTAGRLVVGTLTVAAAGATITGSPVALSGTSPRAITLAAGPNPRSGTSTVSVTNATAGNLAVTGITLPAPNLQGPGSGLTTWYFDFTTNGCTAANLAPGATCTKTLRFNNVTGTGTHTTTITYTDGAAGSPQTATVTGTAN
jgi:hypothetical protein